MKIRLALIAALAACVLWAAPAGFEPVPGAALKHLKGTRGKPIRKGVVFVNGRYLPPPYTVWRKGTAIFIGKTQVTGQIVPWSAFAAAQGAEDGAVAAPRPVERKPAHAPAQVVRSVDDLFDDEPAVPQAAPAASAPAPAAEPEFTGAYSSNATTKRYLKRITNFRTDVDRRLRRGEILFFGTRYSMLHVEDRLCMPLMNALPGALREAVDAYDLQSRLKSQGITYLSNAICEDLFANQAFSFAIDERRAKMQDEADVMKILDEGAQGVVR